MPLVYVFMNFFFQWNLLCLFFVVFLPCLQLISKNLFDEAWRGFPPPFLTSKMEEWLMMTFVLENCLLNLFVVLDLDLGSILIDNFFFFVSQKLEINIIYFICFWQQYEKCHSVYMCRFQWNYPILRHVR